MPLNCKSFETQTDRRCRKDCVSFFTVKIAVNTFTLRRAVHTVHCTLYSTYTYTNARWPKSSKQITSHTLASRINCTNTAPIGIHEHIESMLEKGHWQIHAKPCEQWRAYTHTHKVNRKNVVRFHRMWERRTAQGRGKSVKLKRIHTHIRTHTHTHIQWLLH